MKIIESNKIEQKDVCVGDIVKVYDEVNRIHYRMVIESVNGYNMIELDDFTIVYSRDYDRLEEMMSWAIQDWDNVSYIKHEHVNMTFDKKFINIK